MKKLILFIFVSLVFIKTNAQVNNPACCPEKFELKQLINDRQCDLVCDSSFKELNSAVGQIPPNGPVPGQKQSIVACKNSQMTYLVIPNLPGFTYTWAVTGGTIVSPNPGNPVTINWGNVTKGSIVVTITNGTCIRKIAYDICLLDKPVANFTFNPSSPLCINNLIQFNNTSLGGATYFWSFGNGQTSTDVNPQYTYTTPGTYVVTLVVKSKSNGCGCTDSIQQTIVVNDGPGISGCDKMLCPGDTATYCSTKTCGSYSWSIPAGTGTIIGSSTQNCVRIAWSNTQPGTLPVTITLTTTGCGACNTTTLPVNIVWPAIPIKGNTVVCVGSTETYSLPVMPGTFYSWSLSGGGNIVNSGLYPTGYPNNNPQINIDWTTPGTYNLTVNYNNPNTKKKCGGSYTLSITVKPKFKITGMTSVCAGTTGMYMTQDFSLADWTVTGGVLGTDYTFASGPNGVSNFQVNWITSGVYQLCGQPITANIPNYCNANPVCVSVLVKPTPVVTVGGSNLVCPNVLTNYVASSTPSGSSFVWSVSPVLAQSPAPYGTYDENASIIFNGTAPWTVTAQTTLNGCTGSNFITVNQLPAPTLPATPLTACIGGQVTISVASGTGPFTWSTSPAATLVSGQGTGTATYELHGSGTITVSNCSGPSNAVSVSTTLPVAITIVKTGSLCTANLQLTAPIGGTYLWTGGLTTQVINVTLPGTYTVQVTFPGGCKSVATYTVVPEAIPIVTISTANPLVWCIPATPLVNMAAFTLGVGCTYKWYKNLVFTGVTTSTYTATTAGSYYVEVKCGLCVATSNVLNVQVVNCVPIPGCATPLPPNPFGTINITGPCNTKTFSITGLNACVGGIVAWDFGDGNTATGNTVTHTYANAGVYGVTASMICSGCKFIITSNTEVPLIPDFNFSVLCTPGGGHTITLNNTSQVLGGWTIGSVNWLNSGCGGPGSFVGNTFVLNAPPGCSPFGTMTITVTKPGFPPCTLSVPYSFSFGSATLTINGPLTVCKDQMYSFSSSMTGTLYQYQWTVNGVPVSQNNPLSYAFSGVPINPVLGLNVTDAFGCTFSTTVTLNVVTPPTLSITPSPIIKVCQAPCLTTGSVITATPGFTNYEWFQNGVSLGAPSGSNTYTITGPSPIGTYYVQAQSLPNLCNVKSNTVSVIYHPKPKAKIIANTNNCIASVPFNLTSGPSNPSVSANPSFTAGYQYDWFLNNLGTPIYNSNTTNYLNYTINSFGTYTFIVKVTEVATGCCNLDTICIAFSKNPNVTIAPGGPLCEGPVVTLTANATPAGTYYYSWENGQQGTTHLVQAAGMYSVQAMDDYGCAASAYFTIKPMPYIALFPQGCDTICLGDTNKLQFPLPTNISGQPAYTIVWSLPGGVGTTFPLSTLGLGSHTITATVTMNGCTATTAAYNVFVKNCDTCNCKESYWKEGPLWTNVTTGEQIKIDCKKHQFEYVIQDKNCKDSFNLSGIYICKGTNCPGKVTFSLYNANNNAYIGGGSGNYGIPANLLNGSYYITIYAYCGDLICDSCKIFIKKDCDKGCDCNKPDFEIEPVLIINNANKKIKCDQHFKVNCLSNVTLTANYFCTPSNCPATITYQLTGPISQTGNLPLSLSALPAGSYTIMLTAYCGGKICKECKLTFEVVCEKDCCPYDIKATLQSQSTSMSPGNTNLLVNQAFNFTGLTGASLTEIRAEVLSYNLTSQFPEQCIGCKNLPKGWASIYNGNVMGPVIPKVNLAGVMTNAPLNVSSLSTYSNPREIIWNNGGAIFSIVQPVTLGFILPKPSPLDCCDATAEICVKFTFRDKDCKECEVIICFKVVIKKK
jgi:PKD repeat protein